MYNEMKHNFKIGDRVFDINHGWMIVKELESEFDNYILKTETPNRSKHAFTWEYYEDNLKTLSFTEYTLDGFSQERPKEEFKI